MQGKGSLTEQLESLKLSGPDKMLFVLFETEDTSAEPLTLALKRVDLEYRDEEKDKVISKEYRINCIAFEKDDKY